MPFAAYHIPIYYLSFIIINIMASITFFGAAGTVTGSCHLIKAAGKRYLMDCGQFQGPWSIEVLNYRPFGFNPAKIDGLILSHGHLDHCGRIPVLAREGFEGHIYSTPPTRDVARLILMDSAHVLKEEFLWKKRRLTRAGIKVAEPLFSLEDVYYCLDRFDRVVPYDKWIELDHGLRLRFQATNAGHILGSSQIYMEYPGPKGTTKRLLYTGDIGDEGRPLEKDPTPPRPPIDTLVIESTYGDRDHRSYEASVEEFEEAITSTIKAKGTVLIPTFALERAQEILYHLGNMRRSGRLPKRVPVFLNSPLAIDLTRLYAMHCRYCREGLIDPKMRRLPKFAFPGLYFTETAEESKAIHYVPDPKIILAGSGMMTGGRIKHHLKHLLWKESTTIIIVGYQATGTLGRKIIDGADEVRIFGEPVAVRARIYTINGFSAHAGRASLIHFAEKTRAKKVFVVHGEPHSAQTLKKAIEKRLPRSQVIIPKLGEHFGI